VIEARSANALIASRNRRFREDRLRPFHKYIAGDGHALAIPLCGQPQLNQLAMAYQPQAPIDAVPPNWDAHIMGYSDIDIIRLVIFYNDDFGIVANDVESRRKEKLILWFTEWI